MIHFDGMVILLFVATWLRYKNLQVVRDSDFKSNFNVKIIFCVIMFKVMSLCTENCRSLNFYIINHYSKRLSISSLLTMRSEFLYFLRCCAYLLHIFGQSREKTHSFAFFYVCKYFGFNHVAHDHQLSVNTFQQTHTTSVYGNSTMCN